MKPHIKEWPVKGLRGSKRTNIEITDLEGWDWFGGFGKSDGCQFEGSWWDMVCFARNILASENTKLAAPEFYRPDLAVDHYTEPGPYTYGKEKVEA